MVGCCEVAAALADLTKMLISSLQNPTIKQIRRLAQRKAREQTGFFFAEGIRIVAEAIQLQAPIETLVLAPDLLTSPFAQALLQAHDLPRLPVTAEVFRSLALKDNPQGLGAVVRQQWSDLSSISQQRAASSQPAPQCWVALASIQDPGNLGTILRTCDAVGATGLILLDQTTDPYDPAALRASTGAIFGQTLVRASFEDFATWRAQQSFFFVGAAGAAPLDYREAAYPFPLVILMGSEREGLTPSQQALCDALVRIPMVGRCDSLNLAVATSLVLYEMFRQHQPKERFSS